VVGVCEGCWEDVDVAVGVDSGVGVAEVRMDVEVDAEWVAEVGSGVGVLLA
jgi:hypothetical protein